jgi:predicted DNA-binding transcriptional regulator AlpA
MEGAKYISRKEVADLLGVTERSLIRWSDQGIGPPARRIGNKTIRYERTAVEKWFNESLKSPRPFSSNSPHNPA